MSHFKELSDQAFKNGMVSNGVALTLSVVTYARIGGAAVGISKFPMWCFFIGLIIGGLILLGRMTAIGLDYIDETINVIAEVDELLEDEMALDVQTLKDRASLRKKITELKETLDGKGFEKGLEIFRNIPQFPQTFRLFIGFMLYIQYFLFIIGAGSAIANL